MTYRLRLLVTARDVDAVAYDAVLNVSAKTAAGNPGKGEVHFHAHWKGLDRVPTADAPFGL